MIKLTPADVIRLKALGIAAEPEAIVAPQRDDDIIIALNDHCRTYYDALLLSVQSERRAWREARRWRMWGWLWAAGEGLEHGFLHSQRVRHEIRLDLEART